QTYEAGLGLVAAGPALPELRDNAVAMRTGLAAARRGLGDLAGADVTISAVLADLGGVAPSTAAYAWATAAEIDLARGDRTRAEDRCRRALALLPESDAMVPELRRLLARTRSPQGARRK